MTKSILILLLIIGTIKPIFGQENSDYFKEFKNANAAFKEGEYTKAFIGYELAQKLGSEIDGFNEQCTQKKNLSAKKIKERNDELTSLIKESELIQSQIENETFSRAALNNNNRSYWNEWVYEEIDTLDLSNNQIEYLPKNVKKCSYLKSLDLRGNENLDIDSVFKVLDFLPLITDLKITVNSLDDIPSKYYYRITGIEIKKTVKYVSLKKLEFFSNLKALDISGANDKKRIVTPKILNSIFKVTHLESINFSYCELNIIPKEIAQLEKLRVLILSHNELQGLPEELKTLQNIRIIKIDNNSLANFPLVITDLKKLESLDISNNQLSILPMEIENLTRLNCLNIQDNNLSKFGKGIISLSELRILNTSKNQITELPVEIQNFERLEHFNMSHNYISYFPKTINSLQHLKTLYANRNQLSDISLISGLGNLREINFSGNSITKIPEGIFELKKLKKVNLSKNQITSIPTKISGLVALEELNIESNEITEIPMSIRDLTNLNYVFLKNNSGLNEDKIAKSFRNYFVSTQPKYQTKKTTNSTSSKEKLKKLRFQTSRDTLNYLPGNLERYRNLRSLTFRNPISRKESRVLVNKIIKLKKLDQLIVNYQTYKNFPEKYRQLITGIISDNFSEQQTLPKAKSIKETISESAKNLTTTLKVEDDTSALFYNRQFTHIEIKSKNYFPLPSGISNLQDLEYLSLTKSRINDIGKKFAKLDKLKTLKLNNCLLAYIAHSITRLDSLERLELNNNKLKKLPSRIGNFKYLTSLKVNKNEIEAIPSTIGKLSDLEIFEATKNEITKIPNSIRKLKNLRVLKLTKNYITEIPDEIKELENLEILILKNNSIAKIPIIIGTLKNLEVLDLSSNKLSKLPVTIGNLDSLKYLNLQENEITQLPKEIGQLENLKSLKLSNNKLSKLPSELFNLGSLFYLDLSNNKLKELPKEIGKLKNLSRLYLKNTGIKSLPIEIKQLKHLNELYLEGNNISKAEKQKIINLVPEKCIISWGSKH